MRKQAIFFCLASGLASAQGLTIGQAVAAAQDYPAERVPAEQARAAAAAVNLARTAYLPRVDALAQLNRATHNNVEGMLLPNGVIAGISGPPRPFNNMSSIWGTAVGALVSWEPFDFGLREAQTGAAEAARRKAERTRERVRFETVAQAADVFLTTLAAGQTIRAAEAAVARGKVLAGAATALVRAQLRPGADQSRAEAELAAAEAQVVQARQAAALSRATLAQFVGREPGALELAPGRLLELPAAAPAPGQAAHPAAAEQQAAVEEAEARRKELDKSYYPKFSLQGALYARGTGVNPAGLTPGGANGLAPNLFNYGLGFSVLFPVLDYAALNARKESETAQVRAAQARAETLARELQAGVWRAEAALEGARGVAATTPRQLAAARASLEQATARYKAGLGTLSEVAEAQRLVTQADIDDALARLNIWRALLALATARGDLAPFLQAAGN